MSAVQAPQMTGRSWLTAKAARLLGHDVPPEVTDEEAVRFVPARGEHHRHTDGDCGCGEGWPCQFHAPTCPTCGSYEPDRTDGGWYLRCGQECGDGFHAEADGG